MQCTKSWKDLLKSLFFLPHVDIWGNVKNENEINLNTKYDVDKHFCTGKMSQKWYLATSSAAPLNKKRARFCFREQQHPKSSHSHGIVMPGVPQIPEPRDELCLLWRTEDFALTMDIHKDIHSSPEVDRPHHTGNWLPYCVPNKHFYSCLNKSVWHAHRQSGLLPFSNIQAPGSFFTLYTKPATDPVTQNGMTI